METKIPLSHGTLIPKAMQIALSKGRNLQKHGENGVSPSKMSRVTLALSDIFMHYQQEVLMLRGTAREM